jgi:hypothetical protein
MGHEEGASFAATAGREEYGESESGILEAKFSANHNGVYVSWA